MAGDAFQLNEESLGEMVAEVGAADGPGSSNWDASGSKTRKVNEAVIQELRANGGRLSEDLESATGPLLILTTIGAKTRKRRAVPLGYLYVQGRLLLVGSMAGSARNPPWYYNLVTNSAVEVELNGELFEAQAQVLEGADREQIFRSIVAVAPVYATIQDSVARTVSVIELKQG